MIFPSCPYLSPCLFHARARGRQHCRCLDLNLDDLGRLIWGHLLSWSPMAHLEPWGSFPTFASAPVPSVMQAQRFWLRYGEISPVPCDLSPPFPPDMLVGDVLQSLVVARRIERARLSKAWRSNSISLECLILSCKSSSRFLSCSVVLTSMRDKISFH